MVIKKHFYLKSCTALHLPAITSIIFKKNCISFVTF